MEFAGHASPLVLLGSEELAAETTPLTLEANEFGHVMNADQNVSRSMDRQRGNDDVEVVTVEGPASLVQTPKDSPRAGANILKRLQNRFDAFVAVFDQAFQKRDIVTADVKAGARLA